MSLAEDFVRMGLARFFGIRMRVVRIRREHRWLFHCKFASAVDAALAAVAVVLCALLLSHQHSNVVHPRFQQL